MEGWIKLHRRFLTWEWFDNPEMIKLFIYLLLSANHKDSTWQGIEIKRGQLLTGLNSLNKGTKISNQTIRTCLKRLEKTQEINMETNNKYRIITICNYESYQEESEATNKQTNKQPTSNQQATNNKQECKNEKKEKIKYIYDEFYDNELKNSNEDKNYKIFVGWLFGDNYLKRPLKNVLSMREQMNFKQFESFHAQYKLIMQDSSIVKKPKVFELLIELEDWVVLERKHKLRTLAGMLRTFMNRNITKKY